MNSSLNSLVSPAIVVLLALAGYQHSLDGDYVFDDTVAILKNADVTGATNLSAIFQHDFWGLTLTSSDSHKSFRPLTTLMFNIEYTNGFRAKSMKSVNLILHCLNTFLLWRFLQCLDFEEAQQVATISSSLFALHPIHVEAVAGVVGRAELMFCLVYLLSLLLTSNRDNGISTNLFIIALTGCGILFKETAITIPIACVFLDYMIKGIYNLPWPRQLSRLLCVKRNIFFVIMTLVFMVLRLWIQNFESPIFKPMDNPIAHNPDPLTRILSQHYLYVVNFWILLCPQWLSFDWALGCVELVTSIWDLRLQAVLALYSFLVLIVSNKAHDFGMILALGLLIIPFLPASGIIKLGLVVAERLLYVPSIGYCLLVANSFCSLMRLSVVAKTGWLRNLMKCMLMLVFLCFLLKTQQRASEWQTEEKLFTSALRVCPKNAKVHYNIARLASDKLELDKAKQFYHNAIELYPAYEAALMNLGNLYRESGDLVTAEKYLKAALNVFPEFSTAWMNLGIVQSSRKQYTAALESYRNALKYRKNYAVCYYNLGNLYLEQKHYNEAMQNWQKAVTLNPRQPKAWANILTMLDNKALYEDGLRISEQALIHLPNETSLMFIRANIFGKMKHYVEAEALYKRAVALEPKNVLYHTNFAILYHRWGKYDQAIEGYQRALSIDPKNAITAKDNLQKLQQRLQQENDSNKGSHGKRFVTI